MLAAEAGPKLKKRERDPARKASPPSKISSGFITGRDALAKPDSSVNTAPPRGPSPRPEDQLDDEIESPRLLAAAPRADPPPEADPFSDVGDPFVGNGEEVDVEAEAVQLLSSQNDEEAQRIEQKVARKLRQAAHQRSPSGGNAQRAPSSPRKPHTAGSSA